MDIDLSQIGISLATIFPFAVTYVVWVTKSLNKLRTELAVMDNDLKNTKENKLSIIDLQRILKENNAELVHQINDSCISPLRNSVLEIKRRVDEMERK